MIHIGVSVYDSASNLFGRPILFPARGAAVRSFQDEVNRKAEDNQMFQHPDDFSMIEIAKFDDVLGRFEPCEHHVLARGKDLVSAA